MTSATDAASVFTEEAAEYLNAHAVDLEHAASLGVRSVTQIEDVPEEFARYGADVLPAILLPWTDPAGREQPQLKVLAKPLPTWLEDAEGYVCRSREQGYQPPFWELRKGRTDGPVLICAGSKQCLVAARYAPEEYSVYGIAGCTSWSQDGMPTEHLGLVQDRDVVVLFDADFETNANVFTAAEEFYKALTSEGAGSVKFAELPVTGDEFAVIITGTDSIPAQGYRPLHARRALPANEPAQSESRY